MKVFKNEETAEKSSTNKEDFYLNSVCPYQQERILCGNWCALFYFAEKEETEEKNTSPYVILGCKAGEKLLYVEEVIGD